MSFRAFSAFNIAALQIVRHGHICLQVGNLEYIEHMIEGETLPVRSRVGLMVYKSMLLLCSILLLCQITGKPLYVLARTSGLAASPTNSKKDCLH